MLDNPHDVLAAWGREIAVTNFSDRQAVVLQPHATYGFRHDHQRS